jgi:hypothetical protein
LIQKRIKGLGLSALEYWSSNLVLKNLTTYWIGLHLIISNIATSSPGYYFKPGFDWTILIEVSALSILFKIIPKEFQSPLDALQIVTAVFLTIPTLVLAFRNEFYQDHANQLLTLLSLILVQFLFRLLSDLSPKISIMGNWSGLRPSTLAMLLSILSILILIFVMTTKGLELKFVGFTSLYEERAIMQANLREIDNPALSYALGWLIGLIPGLLMAFFMFTRKKYLLFLSLLTAILAYISSFQKGVVASLFLVIFLFLITKNNPYENFPTWRIFGAFNKLLLVSVLLNVFLPKLNLIDAIVRRALIDPSIMYQYYFRFSREHPLLKWSDISILGFSPSKIGVSAGEIIGDRYFYSPQVPLLKSQPRMNATSGALGDSLAQFGILGLIIVAFLLFVFFYVLQIFSVCRDRNFVFILSMFSAVVLIEGTLQATLLSRGLVLVPLLLLLLQKEKQQTIT